MPGKHSKDNIRFSGPALALCKTEHPIYRQIIQYSYFLTNTYPDLKGFAISKLIAKDVIDIWKAGNPRLPLLKEKTIINKVNNLCFQKVKQINRKSLPVVQLKCLEKRLDTLFDISFCLCQLPVLKCDDDNIKCNTENCQSNHIFCTCSFEEKVPVEELKYLKDLRTKIRLKNTFQLGPTDKSAGKKRKRETERLDQEKNLSSSLISSTLNDVDDVSSHSQSNSSAEETDEYWNPESHPKEPYNLVKIPHYAIELIKGDVSSDVGARLANAFFSDLRAMGLLTSNVNMKSICIDEYKIDSTKANMKTNAHQKLEVKVEDLV